MSQRSPQHDERHVGEGDISLGRELRRAREVRGISVAQIALETKISERYIHALENDRFDLLPGHPYTANFVRSIARTIGADEEELIDYLNYHQRLLQPDRSEALRSGGPARTRSAMPLVLALGAILVIVVLTMALRGSPGRNEEPQRAGRAGRASAPLPATVAAPLVAAPGDATAAAASGPATADSPVPPIAAEGPPPAPRPPPVLAGLVPPATAPVPDPLPDETTAPAPAGPTTTGPAGASAALPVPTVRLVWRAGGWIQAEQGSNFYVKVHQPGDELTWTLGDPLSLQIGNSGNVDMYIDGQLARPLGGESETRRLLLDSRNWKSFLR